MTIMIFNKTTERFIKHINAAIFENTSAIPYDVTMYDLTVQQYVDCEYCTVAPQRIVVKQTLAQPRRL